LLGAQRHQRVFDDFVELGLGDGRLTVWSTASTLGNLLRGTPIGATRRTSPRPSGWFR